MEGVFLAYGVPKETVTELMMLNKDTKAMVHLPNSDTDFFEDVSGVFQGDMIAPSLFIICRITNYECQ